MRGGVYSEQDMVSGVNVKDALNHQYDIDEILKHQFLCLLGKTCIRR